MTPELWQQVREVLAEALEMNPQDRPAFLDRSASAGAQVPISPSLCHRPAVVSQPATTVASRSNC